jgi:DNA-binding phage protein
MNMALTRDFKETVAARVQNDPAFAQALLDEAITLFINGEPDSAKLILRDLVNATVGFEALALEIDKPSKSLHRMLSKSGNPTMSNISAVFAAIKRTLKVEVHRSGSANSDTGIKKSDGLAQLGEDFACTRRADREKTPSQPFRSLQGEGRVRSYPRRATAGRARHQVRCPRHADRAVEGRASEGRRSCV